MHGMVSGKRMLWEDKDQEDAVITDICLDGSRAHVGEGLVKREMLGCEGKGYSDLESPSGKGLGRLIGRGRRWRMLRKEGGC